MYIDTHCHLNFKDFDEDRAMTIGNAKKAGVKRFIVPGVNLYSSEQAIELSKKHPGVIFSAIGIHPYEAQMDAAQTHETLEALEALLAGLRTQDSGLRTVVAIGECGLDYHLYKGEDARSKKQNQRTLFREQLKIGLTHHLPVIMHCRDAFSDFFDVIDSIPDVPRGVIHCFSGGLQELRMATDRNLFIGVDGNVTYSTHHQMLVPEIPLSTLLLETDAPYLTPIPHRGTRNEPKYIPSIAQEIARLMHQSKDSIQTITTQNAVSLFQIS
ncbi:MAG: TatD family hydrolase [bacterium]|nr:TatD family hydrolase [bacterium]